MTHCVFEQESVIVWTDYATLSPFLMTLSKKDLKLKYPNSNISVQFPAKLVKDGCVVRDEFPNWHTVLKPDRLDQHSYDMADQVRQGDRVFKSGRGAQSNDSDTDVDLYDHVDDGPRPTGIFFGVSGAVIRPLSQWQIPTFFPNFDQKIPNQKVIFM